MAQHQIAFEIVPGITSGIAAPAYAGIPVTHRDYSSSVAFVTAVNKPGMSKDDYWAHLRMVQKHFVFIWVLNGYQKFVTYLLNMVNQ